MTKRVCLGETSGKLNVWLRQSVIDTYRALWQHSKFLQIWGLKCAKQLKYQHEWPWASFGATYRHQLVLQSSTSSLKIPGWSADNNLAHNPSDQDRVQCTKAGESSLDFFFKIKPVGNIFHSARTGKAWPASYHCFASINTLPFYWILILASLW